MYMYRESPIPHIEWLNGTFPGSFQGISKELHYCITDIQVKLADLQTFRQLLICRLVIRLHIKH